MTIIVQGPYGDGRRLLCEVPGESGKEMRQSIRIIEQVARNMPSAAFNRGLPLRDTRRNGMLKDRLKTLIIDFINVPGECKSLWARLTGLLKSPGASTAIMWSATVWAMRIACACGVRHRQYPDTAHNGDRREHSGPYRDHRVRMDIILPN